MSGEDVFRDSRRSSGPLPPVVAAGLVCLLATTVCGVEARASAFELFGAGGRSAALGGVAAASSGGYAAIYGNPAGMNLRRSTAGAGLMVTFDNARIRLSDRPPGYDSPDLGTNSPAIPAEFRLRDRTDTQGLDRLVGVVVGATSDLGTERLRLGTLAFIPVNGVGTQRTWFVDEREQYFSNRLHFDLLGNRNQHQVILVAASYGVLEWLSVGAGLSFMPKVDGVNRVYIDNIADLGRTDLVVDIDQSARWRPTLGLLATPDPQVAIGLVFRDAQFLSMATVSEIQPRGLHDDEGFPFVQEQNITTNYAPRQFVLGANWTQQRISTALDLAYLVWSDFPDADGGEAGFRDTISTRLGVEVDAVDGHEVRLGLAWEPTPVPPQPGRTNHVDNDRLVTSTGMGHQVSVRGSTLRFDWYLQVHWLVPQHQRKRALDTYPACAPGVSDLCDEVRDGASDPSTGEPWPEAAGLQTGNPGFPGFSSGGWVAAAGVEARWEF